MCGVLSLPFHSTITTLFTCSVDITVAIRVAIYVSCRRIVLDIVFLFIYPAFLVRRTHTDHDRADETKRACVSCKEIASTELLAVCWSMCRTQMMLCTNNTHFKQLH